MSIGMALIMTGIAIIIGAQFITLGMTLYFKQYSQSLKCIFIPLYQWVYVRTEPKATPLKWATVLGIVSLITGVVLSA